MNSSNEIFESYVPVYDAVPDKWEQARPFIVEQLKRMSNAINVREIGWLLDEELLSGKSFIPGSSNTTNGATNQLFRAVFRKVVVFPGLAVGVNTRPHSIAVNSSFSLVQLYGAATDVATLTGEPIPNGADTISYDVNNIIITVSLPYTRAWAVIEYLLEV